ncbi:hypothetical protein RUM43_008598, partial [Polyplax serrata]
MTHWTPVMFHRRSNPLDNSNRITPRKDDDFVSICSVMGITLPRLGNRGKQRDVLNCNRRLQ